MSGDNMKALIRKDLAFYNIQVVILALSFVYIAKKYTLVSGNHITAILLFAAGVFFWLNRNHSLQRPQNIKIPYSFIPVFLLFFWFAYIGIFGKFDVSSIVFHLQMGAGGGFLSGIYKPVIRYLGSFLLFAVAFVLLLNLDKRFLRLDRALCMPLLLVNPMFWGLGNYWIADNPQDDRLLSAYQEPGRPVVATKTPKNLIVLYAESMERTLGNIAHGDYSFAEMNHLAKQGLEFAGVRQVENTGWSMAGFVTSQCGMPLQPFGLLSHNMFNEKKDFYTGIDCLSDILGGNQYHTEFIDGGDHNFAGMAPFLKTHQFSAASGLAEHNKVAGDYRNGWGLYDDTLLSIAADRVRDLTQRPKPYMLSIATIGAHFPTGNPTRSCAEANIRQGLPEILYAVKCSGYEIERFVETLRREGLLQNTLLVIVSDHLMMKAEFDEALNAEDRMNYLVVLGDDIAPATITRDAAMFDVMPTVLDLLGFELNKQRAGLGVSLLSEHKTLAEQYGYSQLNEFITNDTLLAHKAWLGSKSQTIVALQ